MNIIRELPEDIIAFIERQQELMFNDAIFR